MDNQNNNKRSPLDEIKRVTREATTGGSQRQVHRAPDTQNNPSQAQAPFANERSGKSTDQNPARLQKPSAPANSSERVSKAEGFPAGSGASPSYRGKNNAQAQRTAPSPRKPLSDDFDIEVPDISKTAPKAETLSPEDAAMSRAAKVRMARQNAMRAREEAQKTRVMDISMMTPEQKEELERQREEARRLVRENAVKYDNSKTRITNTVPSMPVTAANKKETMKKNKRKSPRSSSEISDEFEETIGKGVLSNTVKAVIYIVSVLVVSACLSLFAIFVGNDCFAFVKNDTDITITIPEDAGLSDIARILHDNDVIKYPNMFKLYITIRKKDTNDYISGEYTVNPMMSYDTLISKFKPSSTRSEITVTIVEGSTTDEIIDLFVSKGIGTKEGFVDAIQNYDFDFWFIDNLDSEKTSQRKYRLDGYLFPDTYNFYTNASEEDVIYKLLSNFEAKFDRENEARAKELGLSVDDIVIMASMIQKEAKYVSDYPIVSSVFHNRLNSNVTGRKLESNATVQYTMPAEEVKVELSYEQISKYDNKYNTFLYEGLPIGPICNASLNAINWAMYPNDTNYYYFVSDADGYNHYAATYSEHLANIAAIEREG